MSRRTTTRAQVSGYRFGLARAEHALVRRDVRMVHDPMRSQVRALVTGGVVAVLILAGGGVYGLIRPAPTVGDARIVADSGGGLFVLVDGVMHPVLNLASARLVVGGPAPVKSVSARSLREYPRGPTLGIAGAPGSLPGPADDGSSTWTVCDGPDGTAVVAGSLSVSPSPRGAGAVVSYGGHVWLLFDDGPVPVRARVDTSRVEVVRALGLEDAEARSASAALLDSFPERPELTVPDIADRGTPGPLGLPVGSVMRTAAVDGSVVYRVVLRDGVQEIPATAADMLRAADRTGGAEVREVAPGELTSVPHVTRLPLDQFPESAPRIVDSTVLCRTWSRARDERSAHESMLSVDVLPVSTAPVRLASADGPGSRVDLVLLPPGTAEHVAVTGAPSGSALAGQRFVIADTGVRYRLAGEDAGPSLGLGDDPPRMPWSILSRLPAGPELSRAAALTARD
ncbi:type VII secretion protein EccB [Gordonia sp. PDNC005]|uniref:type VII secretion protein EccB n=1 Tax=unclassified Gordonia (in: high G+C Gram-positive bacteria) TaxID=2657482 RepID=UPI001965DA55|nr:type VII secretion protein EccB [Gordonia sp. PDNC005]QRY61189.1 type VII secretion protein EccB [Gordonia sp. PDNC005]